VCIYFIDTVVETTQVASAEALRDEVIEIVLSVQQLLGLLSVLYCQNFLMFRSSTAVRNAHPDSGV